MSKIRAKLEQVKSLKNGKGIQHLLNEAYKIVGNPMILHDMDYKLIAYVEGVIVDDPLWNELVQTGGIGKNTEGFIMQEGFIDDLANSNGKAAFLKSETLMYDRISKLVDNGHGVSVGELWTFEVNEPFEANDTEFIDAVGELISKELAKDQFYLKYGQAYQSTIMRKLIEGSIEDRRFYSVHVANLDRDLKDNIYLAVADTSQCNSPAHTNLEYFTDIFQRTRPAFKYMIYDNCIIILMSTDGTILYIKNVLGKLYGLFEQHNIYVGISSGFENLYELSKYYAQAVKALQSGLKSDGSQRIFLHNDED